ncbi:MAG TPA: sigma 54-interacting transcriptional regulator, partial [Myxococcota bacterium]|nr:sigma 54-interacting transcriptional regulator [Myxococcota bacterium]
ADQARAGAFEEAADGTILLDEIGEMPPELQTRLLRVIESRAFKRVGSNRELPMQARVIVATNRDLAVEVEAGRFRFDLFQRISVFPIKLPPLKDRGTDILLLAGVFLDQICRGMKIPVRRLSSEAGEYLMSYDFPGNVRELRNIIERAVILGDSLVIGPGHLPERVLRQHRQNATESSGEALSGAGESPVGLGFVPGVDTLEVFEERLIREVLTRAGGNKSEAARLLGISRFALMRRLDKTDHET